jgi:hypothetical protein
MADSQDDVLAMTPAEKKQIERQAETAGLSVSEYLRRAVAAFANNDDADETALDLLLIQVEQRTTAASAAIDAALAYIEASNRRLAELEATHRLR